MNGDPGDIDYLSDPLLCSVSNLHHLPYMAGACILSSPQKAATSLGKRTNF